MTTNTTAARRRRKTINASHIEVNAWFLSEDHYRAWATQPFAPRAQTVSCFEWISATLFEDGTVEAVYRFIHTCRNTGAHDSDSRRFFHAVRRSAFLVDRSAEVNSVTLLQRVKTG